MTFIIIIILVFVFLVFLTIQYSIIIPPVKGLPVLMYHKVSEDISNNLTIKNESLKLQLKYIKEKGYTAIFCSELIDSMKLGKALPKKPIIITFDDGYQNNYTYLIPILEELQLKATIFLPVKHIGSVNSWDKGSEPLMNFDTLKSINSELVEFGLHSYAHTNLKNLSIQEIDDDIKLCFSALESQNIKFIKAIAYPFGAYPREEPKKSEFLKTLKNNNIELGFRIGNKINKLPVKNPFELKRIDIKGIDSFWTFKTKLKKGRVKLF